MFENLYKELDKKLVSIPSEKEREIIKKCFFNTIETSINFEDDESVFVLTGDIPAMWLRDSTAQVLQYLNFVDDVDVIKLIKGVIKKQLFYIIKDQYANSFMRNNTQRSMWENSDFSDKKTDLVWERKFELDSLCYPLFLIAKYFEKTNDRAIFDRDFLRAFDRIIKVVKVEQNHNLESNYFFKRNGRHPENVKKANRDKNMVRSGLVWSAFRPSDDACKYNYHIPDNIFLVSVLTKYTPIFIEVLRDEKRAKICSDLIYDIQYGIENFGIVNVKGIGEIYASEVDCKWHYILNDDANIPSLLSIPYLEYPFINKEVYLRTRNYVLSKKNKYYFEGKILKGIGSPHTKGKRVWPLAISMQGITSLDKNEINKCYEELITTHAGTNLMHESINVNNEMDFTRPWFCWANSLFAEFVLRKFGEIEFK